MSSTNNTFDILLELANVVNGILVGVASAYASIKTWSKIKPTYSALSKISQAQTVPISDLRSLISSASNGSESEASAEMLVLVRGTTDKLTPDVLVSPISDEKCVVLEQTFNVTLSPYEVLVKTIPPLKWYFETLTLEMNTSLGKIPFILTESCHGERSDHVFVNFEGSRHSLPLKQVFSLYNNPKYTTCGPQFLAEEKILPIGMEISAVGICSLQDGNPEIKACEELPFFLSEMTRDEIVQWLHMKGATLFLCAVGLGSFSVYLLGCKFLRIWRIWKACKELQVRNKNRKEVIKPIKPKKDKGEI